MCRDKYFSSKAVMPDLPDHVHPTIVVAPRWLGMNGGMTCLVINNMLGQYLGGIKLHGTQAVKIRSNHFAGKMVTLTN